MLALEAARSQATPNSRPQDNPDADHNEDKRDEPDGNGTPSDPSDSTAPAALQLLDKSSNSYSYIGRDGQAQILEPPASEVERQALPEDKDYEDPAGHYARLLGSNSSRGKGSTDRQIKAAYTACRKRYKQDVLRYHPDKGHVDADSEKFNEVTEKQEKDKASWEVLGHANRRFLYDREFELPLACAGALLTPRRLRLAPREGAEGA